MSRRLLAIIALLHAHRAVAQPGGDDPRVSDAEVFERVFQPRPERLRAPAVLVIDGARRGPIVVDLPAAASPLAPAAVLLGALGPRLAAEVRRALIAQVRDQRISIDALRAIGLDATYDPRRLELRLAIPPSLMSSSSHTLRGAGGSPDALGALPPSDVSGFLNVRAGGGHSASTGRRASEADPLHVALDGAIAARAWVLEGRIDVGEAPIGVHRGDVLVSHDDREAALRWLAGDFAVPTGGLSTGYPVLGVGVTRSYALQPYRTLQPVGKFDFVLDRPSRVTVVVNSATIQTLSLPAGRHDIRDLPLGAGSNDIELVIRDDQGVERRLSFSAIDPGELLAPGVAQFTLAAGFPLVADAGLRIYDFARPTLSARRRWGVTSSATAGAALDAQPDRQLAGGSLLHATPLGSISLDLAASRDAALGAGHAEGVRYDLACSTTGVVTDAISVGAHHYSPGFSSLATEARTEHYRGDVALSANRRFGERLFGRLTARYALGRASPDAVDASFSLSRSVGGVDVDASIGFRSSGTTAPEGRVFVSARWALRRRGGSLRATSQTTTTGDVANELAYTRRAGGPAGSLATSVSLRESGDAAAARGEAHYTGYRFTSSVSTTTSLDHDTLTAATSLEVATALAFAGGRAAWSRPITGSFAIVAAHDTVAGFPIGVNPTLDGYAARTDAFGAAVIPNLEAYRVGVVRVEAPTLPVGYSLGPSSYRLLPTYKSGTLLPVGEPGTVSLRGTLRAHGAPVTFAVGELVPIDDKTLPAVVVMSNRAGRFAATGLLPGRYEVRIDQRTATVAIARGATGVVSADIDLE